MKRSPREVYRPPGYRPPGYGPGRVLILAGRVLLAVVVLALIGAMVIPWV